MSTFEHERLELSRTGAQPWKLWGPYLSERQWGTVREDYSDNGDAWSYFSHDQARARAYKWGEDGIAGISDEKQRLCWSLALWNGQDPILKERLFGLTNVEGNHGEDVKEYYFYLDSTPTHSYMKYLYKYPQAAYPYDDLVQRSRQRNRAEMEYELLDTGVFAENRYFDVFVEYAKADATDILLRIEVANRGPDAATLHLLPHLWFRNTWWMAPDAPRPILRAGKPHKNAAVVEAQHPEIGNYWLYCEGAGELLFTENETNKQRLWGQPNEAAYVKDGINDVVVGGVTGAVNPAQTGTKAAAHYTVTVAAGATQTIRLRLTSTPSKGNANPFAGFDATFAQRKQEADDFYAGIIPPSMSADQAAVMRQALAGMLWTKQYYYYDVDRWLDEHQGNPMSGGKRIVRNRDWYHMINDDIISMPDKWEYPWYAAWDLAFHTIALSMVDLDFSREQLRLMLDYLYLHPNGQIPAYEWNFSDVNPPVHAWATIFNYAVDSELDADELAFLKRTFNKLLLNFNWWVNRKDPAGRNLFNGGFLGLDNIGVFDRSAPLPTGGYLEQADGTAWMAFFCLNMLSMSVEIARRDPDYEEFIHKFVEHFLWIAGAMDRVGDNQDEMWDDGDGFFYDVLVLPDGQAQRVKVRSMVGLLPLMAVGIFAGETVEQFPATTQRIRAFREKHPELSENIHDIGKPGVNGRRMLAVVNEEKLRRLLAHMLDEERFLSAFGIRSLSHAHAENPFRVNVHGQEYAVQYLPAESDSGMFGGNSNWRGPVWIPVNTLLVRALLQYYQYYGDDFKVECPTGSGQWMTLYDVAREITGRLAAIFLRGADGTRPVYGGSTTFQEDPHWRDHILFYEYFHGDNGAGLGASHQTGWTGVVARLMQYFALVDAPALLAQGNRQAFQAATQ